MNMIHSDMNALLGSRICHDLISPLGAIGNGVELLQMSGLGDSPELSLITESIENANARIRLFRVAFGAAAPGHAISRGEVSGILKPLGAVRGIRIDWDPADELPRDQARLIFLLLLCAESVLPWGGEIAVATDGGRIRVTITATRMRNDPSLWAQLTEAEAPMPTAAEIHFPLARHAAEGLGRTPVVDADDTRVIVTV